MIDAGEKLLYAKILAGVLEGDVEQMKLASLLGSRWMRRSVPLEEILDLHAQSLRRCVSSKKHRSEMGSMLGVSFLPLKAAVKSYTEAYQDALLSLNRRSRELRSKADGLEAEVGTRTAELERLRADLERKVEESYEDQKTMIRMIEDLNRMNTQLTAARRKLKSSEKLAILGQLSLGLSHELRNPLGVIETTASVLERFSSAETADVRKWTGRIREQTRRCNRVIESVLGFSMHDFRSNDLFRAETVVENAISRCSGNGRINYSRRSGDTIWVNGDEEQLTQAVSHVIMNALEATDRPETIDVSLETARGDGERSHAKIRVIDHGPGIKSEDLPEIFEPFTSSKEGNLGLGLSLCNAIVRKHEGKITVSSRPGRTCFTISIPVARRKG